jgi:two-component system response regulator YesN
MYNVLLAEDELWAREGIKKLIHHLALDFQVSYEAADGWEALNILENVQPDLLITDVKMPGINGLELIRFAKEKYAELPCVIISGYEEFEWARQAIQMGSIDYLLKPVDEKQMLSSLHKVIESKKTTSLKDHFVQHNKLLDLEHLFQRIIEGEHEIIPRFFTSLKESFPSLSKCQSKILTVLDEDLPRNDLQQFISKELGGVVFYDRHRAYLAIVPIPDEVTENLIDKWMVTLHHQINTELHMSLAMGYSPVFQHEETFIDNYQEAFHRFSMRFYYGNTCVGDLIQKLPDSELSQINEKEKKLVEKILLAIELKDQSELKKNMDDLFAFFSQHQISPFQVESWVARMLRLIMNRFDTFQLQEMGIKHFIPFHWVQSRKYIHQLKNDLEDMLEKIMAHQMNDGLSSGSIIYKIQSIIEDEYHDPGLAIGKLAERFHFNASYLSILFKKKTGYSFSQYLADVRLDKAKDMLHRGQLKLYEVSYAVGYINDKSFSRAFKRKYGMTPQDYRRNTGLV